MAFTFHPYTSDRDHPCATKIPAGTKALHDYIRNRFPYTTSMGILNCRDTAYLHRLGWAWDCGIPHTNGSPRLDLGMPIIELLGTNGDALGLVGLIYANRIWRKGREHGPPYTGPHPHHDHAHIELTPHAADTLTVTRITEILETAPPLLLPGARRYLTLDILDKTLDAGAWSGNKTPATRAGLTHYEGSWYWFDQIVREAAGLPVGETPQAMDRIAVQAFTGLGVNLK